MTTNATPTPSRYARDGTPTARTGATTVSVRGCSNQARFTDLAYVPCEPFGTALETSNVSSTTSNSSNSVGTG